MAFSDSFARGAALKNNRLEKELKKKEMETNQKLSAYIKENPNDMAGAKSQPISMHNIKTEERGKGS